MTCSTVVYNLTPNFRSKMTEEEKKAYLEKKAQERKEQYKKKLKEKKKNSKKVLTYTVILNLAFCPKVCFPSF